MPFHHAPLRAALPVRAGLLSQWQTHISRQTFHTSRPLHDDDTAHASKNHYETLNVRTDASQAEIKKSVFLSSHPSFLLPPRLPRPLPSSTPRSYIANHNANPKDPSTPSPKPTTPTTTPPTPTPRNASCASRRPTTSSPTPTAAAPTTAPSPTPRTTTPPATTAPTPPPAPRAAVRRPASPAGAGPSPARRRASSGAAGGGDTTPRGGRRTRRLRGRGAPWAGGRRRVRRRLGEGWERGAWVQGRIRFMGRRGRSISIMLGTRGCIGGGRRGGVDIQRRKCRRWIRGCGRGL